MYDVKGRRAIITGGAMGFGKEFGIRLVGAGCKVCLSDINVEVGEETKKEIQRRFGLGEDSVCFVKANVANEEDWVTMWDYAEKTLGGKVEILCNNAGINPLYGWELNLDVMLVGASRGVFYALERMGRSKGGPGGRIINTASMAGLSISPLGPLRSVGYTGAKQGLVTLTRIFGCVSESEEGVKCYALCPWFADTKLVRDALERGNPSVKGHKISTMEDFAKKTRARALTVEEVGEAMMTSLKLDKNTAVYMIFPDSPLIEYPDYRTSFMFLVVAFAKYIGGPLGLTHFTPAHFYVCIVIILFLAYYLLGLVLRSIF